MKHDYITENVFHRPRRVKRWELFALIACFVLCGVDL